MDELHFQRRVLFPCLRRSERCQELSTYLRCHGMLLGESIFTSLLIIVVWPPSKWTPSFRTCLPTMMLVSSNPAPQTTSELLPPPHLIQTPFSFILAYQWVYTVPQLGIRVSPQPLPRTPPHHPQTAAPSRPLLSVQPNTGVMASRRRMLALSLLLLPGPKCC
jgi:hypothetical protein